MDGKAGRHKKSSRNEGSPPDVASPTPVLSISQRLSRVRRREVPRLALWTPALVGLGVALADFSAVRLPAPAIALSILFGAMALTAIIVFWRGSGFWGGALRILLLGAMLCLIGAAAMERRISAMDAPIWPQSLVGERGVSGRLVALKRSGRGDLKLRLDRLQIEGVSPSETPAKVEIRVSETAGGNVELLGRIGRRVGLRARLFPPPGPAEPGAFDFRRRAYFQGLGALGVQGEGPAARLRDLGESGSSGVADAIAREVTELRAYLSSRARAAAPGVEGAVIAALLVGDRSGLPEPTLTALRDANLAHLLAISGLHMAMVCLTVFAAFRLAFAFSNWRPFGFTGKKAAALGAMIAGFFYLQISGGGAPPERAYVMIACAFGAMLVDRPAVTLRAVALAATILLLLRPESLFEPGFQLSFAATTAMVAVFEASRPVWRRDRHWSWPRGAALWFAALVVSSATAGVATAPFAALIFNRLSRFGLIANLAAVPAMGGWIMPLGVTALALTPLGLDGPIYFLMAQGVSYVLAVAETVSSWSGARIPVPVAPSWTAGLVALAGLWLCLWRNLLLKAFGAAPLLVALLIWGQAERPDLIVSRGGKLLGVMTEQGRAFDRDPRRAQTYSAELWLRRDGDGASLDVAAARRVFRGRRGVREAVLPNGWRVLRYTRRGGSWSQIVGQCRPKTLLIAPRLSYSGSSSTSPWELGQGGCLIVDKDKLAKHGALSFRFAKKGDAPPDWISAKNASPTRPWIR